MRSPQPPADRFPFSASPRNSIVRLCPGRWRWRRGWWGRRSRRRSRRGRRRCCEYGRGQRRRGGHRRGCGGKRGKHHPQRNSPAGPDGSRNARWRRPGRLKFRRSVERKHGGRSGRDRGAGAAHHQRSKRWWWAKCRTRCCQPLTQCCSRGFWVRCRELTQFPPASPRPSIRLNSSETAPWPVPRSPRGSIVSSGR